MTTSSLRTKSSLEMAAAEVAAVKVTIPVFETREFPGRASMRAEALAAGAGWEDWNRALERVVIGECLGQGFKVKNQNCETYPTTERG